MDSYKSSGEKKWRLKDPKVLRIFFSSPFNGMEGEREELTRKYFPQFHHVCNAHGVKFVAVDMRWGITTEAADNAQVINICLRELDRSDVFVGFFGQRYGWHGESDELLQKNVDNATGRYPWLNEVKDRSVTEIEYCHGHLNHPGKLPACICFRDKAYDDALREKAIAEGDKRNINKYSAESEHSSQMMNNLIERVKTTESQLLGLDTEYTNPHEGAKFMFDSVWNICLELIADTNASALTPLQQDRICHDAYISSLSSTYIERDGPSAKLNSDDFNSVNGYLVHGPQGSGKSSLLANLVKKLHAEESDIEVVYHFIGTGPGTTHPKTILQRIVAELENIGKANEPVDDDDSNKSSGIGKEKKYSDIHALFVKMQSEIARVVSLGKRLVLVFDGLNKITVLEKTAKHLYWLPIELPKGAILITSTTSTDKDTFNLLVTEREFVGIEIPPLSEEVQASICKELLMKSGKELSPNQLQTIVDAEQTKNARFLTIVLAEISIFGSFRLLESKINSLVNCDGIINLIQEVLQRLEQDYNIKDHPRPLVNEVLSAIAVSHQGLSETEIKEMFDISSYIWSPFFFALENFLVSHGGLLRFSFPEMQQAVEDRYLRNENERLSALKTLVNYFVKNVLQTRTSETILDSVFNERVASELPWIQKKMGDKKGLAETISDPRMLYQIEKKSIPEFIDLWKATDVSSSDLCSMILDKFDMAISEIHKSQKERYEESVKPPGYMLIPVLAAAKNVFDLTCYHADRIKIMNRIIRILEGIEGKISERVRKIELRDNYYFLAVSYVDDLQYDKAMPLYENIKKECEEILLAGDDASILQTLAYVCHGIGVIHARQLNFIEAEPLFQKSFKEHGSISNELQEADSLTNIGICKIGTGNIQEALEYSTSALQKYENYFFGHLPLNVGLVLTNIALCHRKLNNLDLAEEFYLRSLQVKINSVGPIHEVVGTAYMNLGVLETCRENHQKSEEYTLKAIAIFEEVGMKLEQNEMWQALENRMLFLYKEKRQEEALTIFMQVFPMLKRENKVSHGHTGCHLQIMQYMLSREMFKEVSEYIEAYVASPKLREASLFKVLHHCDSQLPQEERPVRPKEHTVEYALTELWPGNNLLTGYYIQNEVLPANDIDRLLHLLDKMDEMNPDFVHTTYEVGAIWCDNSKNIQALLKVAEAGLLKYPEAHSLKTRKFDALRSLHRYTEAYEMMPAILEKEENNQALMLVCGHIAMQANDLDQCRQLWQKVSTMEDEELASKAKNTLQTLEDLLKEAKETEEKEQDNKSN